jgi:hypothetical protein
LIGFIFGLGLQFHYSFIFAIIVSCVWLFFGKKADVRTIGLLLGGFVIGFFPLILFELRNHFYNLNTIFLILTHATGTKTGFTFNTFYLLSLLPFFIYLLSIILGKLDKVTHAIKYIFFAIYIAWSLFVILSPHIFALSYPDAEQIAQAIELDHPKNFNIADQLTGDNRATSVRYLLTVDGYQPQEVTNYSGIATLYIYSKRPLDDLVKNPIYEIKSFLPFKSIKTQKTADNIRLYMLKK